MQEYAATSQPHLSKTSCHDPKSLFKPPPQNPYMQAYASTSQPPLSKTSFQVILKTSPPKPCCHRAFFLIEVSSSLSDFRITLSQIPRFPSFGIMRAQLSNHRFRARAHHSFLIMFVRVSESQFPNQRSSQFPNHVCPVSESARDRSGLMQELPPWFWERQNITQRYPGMARPWQR